MRSNGAALAVSVTQALAANPAAAPVLLVLPADQYAPGALRASSDAEHFLVAAFIEMHPEYERLGHEGVLQMAATYKDALDHYIDDELRAAGVPVGWAPLDDREELALAEECP